MRVVHVTLIVLLASIALAGCSGKDSSEPTTAAPRGSVGSGTSAPNSSHAPGASSGAPEPSAAPTSAGPKKNTPPSATLTADLTKSTLPANVTFSLKGSDPDGDAVTYSFDANGDGKNEKEGKGTDLPATVKYSYTTAGNYTATFKISDGKNSTTAKQLIQVTGAAVADGPVDHRECTTAIGLDGSTSGGDPTGTVLIGGCRLGDALTKDMTVKAISAAASCSIDASPDGQSLNFGHEVAVGSKWKKGAAFREICNAPAQNAVGTIDLVPT